MKWGFRGFRSTRKAEREEEKQQALKGTVGIEYNLDHFLDCTHENLLQDHDYAACHERSFDVTDLTRSELLEFVSGLHLALAQWPHYHMRGSITPLPEGARRSVYFCVRAQGHAPTAGRMIDTQIVPVLGKAIPLSRLEPYAPDEAIEWKVNYATAMPRPGARKQSSCSFTPQTLGTMEFGGHVDRSMDHFLYRHGMEADR